VVCGLKALAGLAAALFFFAITLVFAGELFLADFTDSFFFGADFFAASLLEASCWTELFFFFFAEFFLGLAGFFLLFFVLAIGAVYHRVPWAHKAAAAPTRLGFFHSCLPSFFHSCLPSTYVLV